MFEDKSMFQFYPFNSDYYKFLYNFNTKSEKKIIAPTSKNK